MNRLRPLRPHGRREVAAETVAAEIRCDADLIVPHAVDAILVEPASAVGRSVLRRFGADAPPVVCISIYGREEGLEPAASVAYLVKPASSTEIADALRSVFAV